MVCGTVRNIIPLAPPYTIGGKWSTPRKPTHTDSTLSSELSLGSCSCEPTVPLCHPLHFTTNDKFRTERCVLCGNFSLTLVSGRRKSAPCFIHHIYTFRHVPHLIPVICDAFKHYSVEIRSQDGSFTLHETRHAVDRARAFTFLSNATICNSPRDPTLFSGFNEFKYKTSTILHV